MGRVDPLTVTGTVAVVCPGVNVTSWLVIGTNAPLAAVQVPSSVRTVTDAGFGLGADRLRVKVAVVVPVVGLTTLSQFTDKVGVSGATALPLSSTVCGPRPSLVVTDQVSVAEPMLPGLYATVSVIEAPGAIVVPTGSVETGLNPTPAEGGPDAWTVKVA